MLNVAIGVAAIVSILASAIICVVALIRAVVIAANVVIHQVHGSFLHTTASIVHLMHVHIHVIIYPQVRVRSIADATNDITDISI